MSKNTKNNTIDVPLISDEDKKRKQFHGRAKKAYQNLKKVIQDTLGKDDTLELDRARLEVELIEKINPKIAFHTQKLKEFGS